MKCLTDSKRAEQGNKTLLGSQFVYIGVFSDDFATVDFREELCYYSRPEKAKFGGVLNADKNRQIIMKYVFDEKYTMLQP